MRFVKYNAAGNYYYGEENAVADFDMILICLTVSTSPLRSSPLMPYTFNDVVAMETSYKKAPALFLQVLQVKQDHNNYVDCGKPKD